MAIQKLLKWITFLSSLFIDFFPDPFLPHVVQLAQQSSDRQTKVAAAELLHSLVLYALGRGVQMSGEQQQRHPMEKLYQKLFPCLLSLACDVEQVKLTLWWTFSFPFYVFSWLYLLFMLVYESCAVFSISVEK